MRVSEGVPRGRIAELYHPEMFQEHEEVIVFTRDEFIRFYNSMQQQISYIDKIDLFLDRDEEWKLIGYWPKIIEKVYLLNCPYIRFKLLLLNIYFAIQPYDEIEFLYYLTFKRIKLVMINSLSIKLEFLESCISLQNL